ncbi:hypothetical protein [Streptomyces sp. NPDC006645]|uniref:hypothetical protein n=1 Tax=unclassified Streptomyces TaxID=2593676 RepID=UPI0033BF4AC2
MTTDKSDLSALESVLAKAVEQAGITGLVNRRGADEDETLELRLSNSRRLPFSLTADEATTWLAAASIDATAVYQDAYLVISLRGKPSVDQMVERLLRPFMYAESVCDRLHDALAQHQFHAPVSLADSGSMVLLLRDDKNLDVAVRLAAVLGAGDIGDGLKLYRPSGVLKLAARLRLLLTGALGPGVGVLAEPGCAHADHGLRVRLTVEQGLRLAGRIAAEPVRAEQDEASSPVEDAEIPPVWISWDP